MVWAPHGHDPDVVDYELPATMMMQGGYDPWYVTLGTGVVVAKELNSVCYAEVVVEKANKECMFFFCA